jgi:hypothetical protein
LLTERPGQGGLARGRVGACLGTQQTGDLAAAGDDLHAPVDLLGLAVVAATQPPLQPLQVGSGAVQLLGAAVHGGLGPRRGPDEHAPHRKVWLGGALGLEGDTALNDPVAAPLWGRGVLVTFGHVVDRGGRLKVQRAQVLGQVGLAGRRDEADLGGVHRLDVAAGDELGVAH